ncbi:SRPBCC family protein [Alteromonas flava]|uniref:SRPBCC family protein n=1 Tax=Alteromonas flava TaxID=2048003 RepID=UPI000C28A2EC|nr:SRPBCC family protein [Alteromonas flava]
MLQRLCIALCFFSTATLADVQHVDTHGFIVENTIVSAHTSEQVWQALVQNVDDWWPKDHSWWEGTFTLEAKAGGCFCETHTNKSAEHMRIVYVEPGKTLRMSGGLGPLQGMGMNGALDWQLTPTEDGTKVTLTYRVHGVNSGGFAELAPIVAHVQGIQLNSLKDFLNK